MPSWAKVLAKIPNTEALALAPPVCIRTLMRSNGCPTKTTQMPPTPPDKNDFKADSGFLGGGGGGDSTASDDDIVWSSVVVVVVENQKRLRRQTSGSDQRQQ
mmetsp:Transcript_27816/g.64570  ORF Transcript_27816/g.64570 Transcript_27816/m.64570 type:complete len:102 (+) Transcript_27816:813-1118(+)